MAHDSQDFSTPQEAIQGYLEALLQDVAEYDEPEAAAPAEPADSENSPRPAADTVVVSEASDNAAGSAAAISSASEPADISADWESDPEISADASGTRVFAPPSAREYAREAAAQIQLRRKTVQQSETLTETALQDQPAVIMPELKVAEPEVVPDVQLDELSAVAVDESIGIAEPEISVAEAIAEASPEIQVTEEIGVEELTDIGIEEITTESEAVSVTEQQALQENEGWSNGRPDWAQGRFECLLFVVKGLKLAVPLAELGGIHKLEKEPTPLFGQPGWFLGIVRANDMNVGLVDTAQWVMSEHINEQHKPDFRFAIRIHNSEWGLACHQVAEAISLDPDQVKWRTKLGRRPWLAGTVVEHMCALIDVAAFARLLDSDKVPVDLQALMADAE